jgi:hypothetical protein
MGAGTTIYLGRSRAGTKVTAIRDGSGITVYAPGGDPIGHLRINHDKRCQGPLTPAA